MVTTHLFACPHCPLRPTLWISLPRHLPSFLTPPLPRTQEAATLTYFPPHHLFAMKLHLTRHLLTVNIGTALVRVKARLALPCTRMVTAHRCRARPQRGCR